MCKIDCIILVLELHTESQRVIIALGLPLHGILVVAHILPVAVPPLTELFGFNLRIHQRLHAMIVETIRFQQIYDVEAVELVGSRVLHTEIVPLGVASRAIIWLEDKIVLEFVHLNSSS